MKQLFVFTAVLRGNYGARTIARTIKAAKLGSAIQAAAKVVNDAADGNHRTLTIKVKPSPKA